MIVGCALFAQDSQRLVNSRPMNVDVAEGAVVRLKQDVLAVVLRTVRFDLWVF